jgi:hypothetical protein
MLYTIGRADAYREYQELARLEGVEFQKAEGGSVWRTIMGVLAHCPPGYAVWEVDANWERDTRPNPEGEPWNDLTRDARLVRELHFPISLDILSSSSRFLVLDGLREEVKAISAVPREMTFRG